MITLYLYDPRQPHAYPVNTPTTFVRSEAFYYFGKSVRRGRYAELWEDGRCIQRMGPHSVLPRR